MLWLFKTSWFWQDWLVTLSKHLVMQEVEMSDSDSLRKLGCLAMFRQCSNSTSKKRKQDQSVVHSITMQTLDRRCRSSESLLSVTSADISFHQCIDSALCLKLVVMVTSYFLIIVVRQSTNFEVRCYILIINMQVVQTQSCLMLTRSKT